MSALDSNPDPSRIAVAYPDDPNTRPHLRERELTITRPPTVNEPRWPEIEVRAYDSTPIPYDPVEAAKLPPAVYDLLEIRGSYSGEGTVLRLDGLDNLIGALTELRDTLAAPLEHAREARPRS